MGGAGQPHPLGGLARFPRALWNLDVRWPLIDRPGVMTYLGISAAKLEPTRLLQMNQPHGKTQAFWYLPCMRNRRLRRVYA